MSEDSGQDCRALGGVTNLNVKKATFRTTVNNPNIYWIFNVLGHETSGKWLNLPGPVFSSINERAEIICSDILLL